MFLGLFKLGKLFVSHWNLCERKKLYLTCAYTHLCRSLSQFLENKSIRSIFTSSAGWVLFHWFVNSPGPFSPIPVCTPGWREAVGEWKLLPNKDIFNWVSKVFQDCCDFASPRSVIGPENARHSLNQSDAKLKPNTTCSPAFSRALGCLVGF